MSYIYTLELSQGFLYVGDYINVKNLMTKYYGYFLIATYRWTQKTTVTNGQDQMELVLSTLIWKMLL